MMMMMTAGNARHMSVNAYSYINKEPCGNYWVTLNKLQQNGFPLENF